VARAAHLGAHRHRSAALTAERIKETTMAYGVFDMQLLQHVFSTEELRNIFSEEQRVQKWYDFEAALAIEQAELGIIPREAAGWKAVRRSRRRSSRIRGYVPRCPTRSCAPCSIRPPTSAMRRRSSIGYCSSSGS
jgi:hypothetical protein